MTGGGGDGNRGEGLLGNGRSSSGLHVCMCVCLGEWVHSLVVIMC